MLELPLIKWAHENLGTLGAVAVLVALISLRFVPQLLAAAAAKRQQITAQRDQRRAQETQDRSRLERRVDEKDAELRTILTNHIAHLEQKSSAELAFHQAAVTQLQEMTHQLREIRRDLSELDTKAEKIKDSVLKIEGGLS